MSALLAPVRPHDATPPLTGLDELPAETAWIQRAVSEGCERDVAQTASFVYGAGQHACQQIVWLTSPEGASDIHRTLTHLWSQPLVAMATCAAQPIAIDLFSPLSTLTQAPDLLARRRRAEAAELVESRAYRSFVQLASWLGRTQEETARVLGIGRTTPLAWRRGHEPQPARARRLYQTHALVSTLVRRLGETETRRWLGAGSPTPLDLIAQGDVRGADDRAEDLIFGPRPSSDTSVGGWIPETAPVEPAIVVGPAQPPRLVARRAPRRRSQ